MKKPGLSVGSIVMMLVTAFVVVGMAGFLSLIAGDDVYERTRAVFGNLAEQTAERETAEPTVSPTKTPFFEATADPTAEPTPTAGSIAQDHPHCRRGYDLRAEGRSRERAGGHGSL